MTCLMSDAKYAPWAADTLGQIEQEKVQKIAILGITPNGEVLTAYYNLQMSDKAVIAAHVQADAVLDSVIANGTLIQSSWEASEEEDDSEH